MGAGMVMPWEPRNIAEAIEDDDTHNVRLLLEQQHDVNATSRVTCCTALACAVQSGRQEMVASLLAARANANLQDEDNGDSAGMTALHHAAQNGWLELVTLLAQHRADLDMQEKQEGWTPLALAVADGRKEIIMEMVALRANVNASCGSAPASRNALHIATTNGRHEAATLLVDAKADVVSCFDESGFTSLHLAAANGRANIVRLMMNAAADPESRARLDDDEPAKTPLQLAAMCHEVEAAEALLVCRASVETRDGNNCTALMVAVEFEATQIVRLLASHRADLEAQDTSGRTSLVRACEERLLDMAKLLIEVGSDANAENESGTPAKDLMVVTSGRVKVMEGCSSLLASCPPTDTQGPARRIGPASRLEAYLSGGQPVRLREAA